MQLDSSDEGNRKEVIIEIYKGEVVQESNLRRP